MNTRVVRTIRRQSVTGALKKDCVQLSTPYSHSNSSGGAHTNYRPDWSFSNFLMIGLAVMGWAFVLTVAWSYQ